MYYVCVENETVVGVQSYEPSVPDSIVVVSITDEQHTQIMGQTHRFDVASKSVVLIGSSEVAQQAQYKLNGIEREFLNSTDWQILRHSRQQLLGIPTSLTAEQYLELEQQRHAAANRIV